MAGKILSYTAKATGSRAFSIDLAVLRFAAMLPAPGRFAIVS